MWFSIGYCEIRYIKCNVYQEVQKILSFLLQLHPANNLTICEMVNKFTLRSDMHNISDGVLSL